MNFWTCCSALGAMLVCSMLCACGARGDEPADVPVLPPPTLVPEFVGPPPPPPPRPPKLWCGGVELGFSGADGNSENYKLRLGGDAKYETLDSMLKLDVLYTIASAKSVISENRLLSNARHEWLFRESPWNLFVSGSAKYDEFTAYDVRLGVHAGLGYQFLKTPSVCLKGRLGAGGSREIGGPNNRFMPEALVGADFDFRISDRQKVTSTIEVFPDLGELGEYRLTAKVAYELLVDPDWNLTLRLGALDNYDSTPEGRKPNDIEYFATLLWKF